MNFPFTMSGTEIISLFFKMFGCVFSLMYFIYAIVVYKQIKIMSKTIQINDDGIIKRENFIVFFTNLQILVALLLFIFSLFVLFS